MKIYRCEQKQIELMQQTSTLFTMHACPNIDTYKLVCMDLSECKFWPLADFKYLCPYICM